MLLCYYLQYEQTRMSLGKKKEIYEQYLERFLCINKKRYGIDIGRHKVKFDLYLSWKML